MDGPSFILTTLQPEIFNDFTIQKPFIAQMSSSLSNAISRTGLDPLKTPLGRWQYGMGASQCGEGGGGGARSLDSILTFPSVNTSASALTRIKRKRKKTVKKKTKRRKGAGKRKKALVVKRGGRGRKKVARKRPAQARGAGRKRRAGKKKSSAGGSRKRKRKALATGGGKRQKKARANASKKKKKTTTRRDGAPRNQPNFSSEHFIF